VFCDTKTAGYFCHTVASFSYLPNCFSSSSSGHITAMDYQKGEMKWRYYDPQPMMAGTLSLKVGWCLLGAKLGTLSLWTLALAKNYGDLN